MNKISVIIADDHELIRKGFADVIRSDDELELVGDAPGGEKALELIEKLKPDIAVLDYFMPDMDGLEVTKRSRMVSPLTSVIILTGNNDEQVFNASMNNDVMGYIVKESTADELLTAIKQVMEGDIYISKKIHRYLINRRNAIKVFNDSNPGIEKLTSSERKVLKLVGENKTNKEIGRELFISENTVQAHRYNICQKLNLKGNNALLLFAINNINYI